MNSMRSFGGFSCTLCSILLLVSWAQSLSDVGNDRALEESEKLANETSGRADSSSSARMRTRNNSPALNHFLEDVLNAQNELKWIDRVAHRSASSRDIETGLGRRNEGKRAGETFDERRSAGLDDELKTKRQVAGDTKSENSQPSLASLKRTIIELSNSLNPRETDQTKNSANEERFFDGQRKLLSSQNARSAMGIAIEYYDYEEENDPVGALINRPVGRDVTVPNPPTPAAPQTPDHTMSAKKNEFAEEEKKEELKLENLKNKVPKEEFISNVQGPSRAEEKSRSSSSNSVYNSPVLRRIAVDDDSDSSDERRWEKTRSRNARNSEDQNSSVEEKILDFYLKSEPEFLQKRTYVLLSPASKEKNTKKRSVNILENEQEEKALSKLNSQADKSARNYAALKSTDDMFKGGVEQSNPLGEDKLGLLDSFSFSAFSTSLNSSPLFKASKTKTTTSPEWKVFPVSSKTKFKHEPSMRGVGRRLTQIIYENPIDNSSISTLFASSSTDKYDNYTIFTQPASSVPANTITKTWSDSEELINSTLPARLDTKTHNNTRLRRNAETFGPENPKPRKRRAQRPKHRVTPSDKKSHPEADDPNKRKLTVLLAADNIDDESQVDLAVHGELAGRIVEKIFEQVQHNEGLKVALGPGLYRKHKPQHSHESFDKMDREGLDEEEVKETEAMMRRVMELLGRLVFDEVRRRTCASLPKDLREFLQWVVGFDDMGGEPLTDQVPPLPGIPGSRKPGEKLPDSPRKFLFPNADHTEANSLNELARKVNLLRGLISEYNALTEREKTQVHTVHDYLLRQLTLLLKFIESKEAAEKKPSQLEHSDGEESPPQILQYAAASSSNFNNGVMTQNLYNDTSRLNLPSNHKHAAYSMFNARPIDLPALNHRVRAFENKVGSWNERKKRKSEYFDFSGESRKLDGPKNFKTNESVVEYHKLLREIATLRRKKRADYLGYETPKIFIEPDETNATTNQVFSSTFWTTDRAPESSSFPNIVSPNLSIPVRGKNRVEDEVLLLNKREAWKKENQLLLEEVAFGKDTRNDIVPEIIENETREKRANSENAKKHAGESIELPKNRDAKIHNESSNGLGKNVLEKIVNVFPVAESSTESPRSSDSRETLKF